MGKRNLKSGALPTIFAWSLTSRPRAVVCRNPLSEDVGVSGEPESLPERDETGQLRTELAYQDHDYDQPASSVEEKLVEAHTEICRQSKELESFRASQFLMQRFQSDPVNFQFYTGFKDYETLKALFSALEPTAESMIRWTQVQRIKHREGQHALKVGFSTCSLSLIDQFFLFLCRVRQGFQEQDLAVRSNVSQSTVSRVCVTWANYLYFMLGSLPIWPDRATVDKLMPICFTETYPKTRVVLDCTEIRVQKPSSKVLNSETYSNYKGTTTLKSLIGISPSGAVTFVSNLFTGSISDKDITNRSGILDLLEEGDEVMADKGFLIKDLLSKKNVSLVVPAFLGPSGKFTAKEVKETNEIARLRIHVERAIRRIKEYHIFDGQIPLTIAGSVNQIWTVCALLTNFKGPLF